MSIISEEKRSVPLFALNNFLRFDRKIYQVFGLQLGRPLPLKGIIYFFTIGGTELIWYFTPVLNSLIRWLPPALLLAAPILLAWLLVDVGTEGRSPVAYFRSFLGYYRRRFRNVTYIRGKEVEKPGKHKISQLVTYGKRTETVRKKVKVGSYATYKY